MKKIITLTVCLAAAIVAAQAQHRLTGTIHDSETNTPVTWATIVLLESPGAPQVSGTITDDSGRFELANLTPGDYRVEVSFLGYEKIFVPVNVPGISEMGVIALAPAANTIGEVVVRASAIQRTQSGYLFSPGLSGVATGRSGVDVLNFAPGVWVKGGEIAINGRGGTRVVVNDRLLNLTGDELAAYLQNINAEQIASIEVLPQAGSQYDASFSGGILKITLKRNVVSGLIGSVGFSVATQEIEQTSPYYVRPRVNLDYRTGKLSIYGSFSHNWDTQYEVSQMDTKYLSGSKRELFKDNRTTGTPKYLNGRFGTVYEISNRHSIGLDFDIYRMNMTAASTSFGTTTVDGATSALNSSYDMSRFSRNQNLSLNYKWKIDDKGSNFMIMADQFHADRDRTEHNYFEEIFTDNTAGVEELRARVLSKSDTYTLRADYTKVFDKVRLEAGAKANHLRLTMNSDNEKITDGAWSPNTKLDDDILYRESVVAAYTNASATLGRWDLAAGLRVENTRLNPRSYTNPSEMEPRNYTDLFPSLNATYAIDPEKGNMIIASYSRTIRRPGIGNLNPYRAWSDNYTYSMGNPHLKAYYMNSLTLTGVLKNKYSLTLGFDYENDVIRYITQKDPDNPDVLVSMPANIDRVVQYYVALSVPIRFTAWWRLNTDLIGDYTFNKMRDYDLNGGRVQGRVVSIFTFPKNFGVDVTYLFTSGNIIGEERSEPVFDKLDLNVRKSFFDKRLTVNLFVDNVLDFRKWSYVTTTRQPDVFRMITKSHSSDSRRTYGVTLRWNFQAGKKIKTQKVVSGNAEERNRQAITTKDDK